MKAGSKQSGLTLTEMAVVIATIALLVGLGLPSFRALLSSFESRSSTKSMIRAALSSARAIAAREQRYAGIRFQEDSMGSQYMVFIVNDPNLDDAHGMQIGYKETNGFRAVLGMKPLKLPQTIGVMQFVDDANQISDRTGVVERTTFSIVFSATGKLAIHFAPVLRKNANDDIFNSASANTILIDDYDDRFPFQQEQSQNRFVIYDRTLFDKLGAGERFNYVSGLDVIYINPYTGTIISPD